RPPRFNLFPYTTLFRSSDRTENKKLAVAKPVSPSAKHDYNYSLPGVRPNGGVEIKHRNSLYDYSDIDANEDDEFANVTLASAPGDRKSTRLNSSHVKMS